MRKKTSPNTVEREITGAFSAQTAPDLANNPQDFSVPIAKGKKDLQLIIRYLARETNRLKLDYRQLKYVFKSVRAQCDVAVPGNKGRKLYELPSASESAAFYAAINNPTHKLQFQTLELTGLRISELCNLEISKIDLQNNQAFVSQGKGGKDRIVIIPNSLVEKLQIYLNGRSNRYLFESNRYTRFTKRRIDQICAQYRKRAGIEKKFTPHTFRHLYCTRLAEAGISQEKRALLVGHASEETQRIYTHLSAGGLKAEILQILDSIRRH